MEIDDDTYMVVGDLARNHDLGTHGAQLAAEAIAVHDHAGALCDAPGAGGHLQYCAWGTDVTGTDFYCAWTTTRDMHDLVEVQLRGGNKADELFFWYGESADSETEYDMDVYSGFAQTTFFGRLFGLDSNDELQGSRSTDSDYIDHASGGPGEDSICMQAGDDLAFGDADEDLVCGDDDDDSLSGGGDPDVVCGFGGTNNYCAGDGGNDAVDHGTGGTSNGGFGNDVCTTTGTRIDCEGDVGSECSGL